MTAFDPRARPESPYAWARLAASLALMTISGVGMYAVAVALPAVQAEFGTARSAASLPYAATMIPLAFMLRRRPPVLHLSADAKPEVQKSIAIPRKTMFALLCIAGVGCCVAMSMPQVHIVAYCGDLGYAAARGAEMLSVMLGFGIVSRLASGWICDRIGGLRTLLLGSGLQGVALLMFLPFDSLASLYVVSALFGLFQGGIVPSYAIIVREYFPPREAGARVGTVLMCTMLGMALGGWMTGVIFDLTGSYRAAFLNGIGWNLLNLTVAFFLLHRATGAGRLFFRGA
jgi:cyanate permease